MTKVRSVDFTRPIRVLGGYYLPTTINVDAPEQKGKYEVRFNQSSVLVKILKEPRDLVGMTFVVHESRLDSWSPEPSMAAPPSEPEEQPTAEVVVEYDPGNDPPAPAPKAKTKKK